MIRRQGVALARPLYTRYRMADTMIRKQVYLSREQNRKLKGLAAQRGCTEAEIIREALDYLPEPGADKVPDDLSESVSEVETLAPLRAAGLLAPKPKLAKPLSREEWEKQRREFD